MPSSSKWEVPPLRRFKINFDGTWKRESKVGGVSFTVRNNLGIFVATFYKNVKDIHYPLHTKVLVAKKCAVWASTKGFCNLIEGDSLHTVGALKNPLTCLQLDN